MSPTIVVDASALIEIAVSRRPDHALLHRFTESEAIAPAVIDAEALKVLRRMAHRGQLTDTQALAALTLVRKAPVTRFDHQLFLASAWQLRHAIAAFDSLYVALAEQFRLPLVTCDAKLAGSNGHNAKIEFYPLS
ncbi:type II toxin-antitoxin system VapC family toxin [Goodfellowiella coeruleoviolacea]|uniref:Ribonuclease VapC n=1 Tax=Goodfellowiella coeruleoviolacea TaxID=334858 RepID=A0AAE3KLJ6_9PSEU|nr:type II toxin-antitoxin system VapC family toxin [Goodfellowiella coeruleoviolacea]MCP2166613.1 putative nucleic acid-binding protein, contains PIN domain [Goodfellowiella coeruleoviolacea]